MRRGLSQGFESLDMYLGDGQWAISGSGFALETAANAPDKDELLLLMEGKEVNTEFGTLNFDKSKVSDVKDIEFIGDGSSYTVSFTADYHSDLFKTTGVFTVTLHWDITGGYRFIKASFIKDSIVLTNKSAFNSTFSSNYSAIEEYGIGTSGNISITFTDFSESNSLVSANVKIAGRTLSMTGTMNPFNCEVSSLHTNQTFNATVEVPMYIFSGLTTTAEFRNIVVSLSGLNFNWDEIKCSGTINIKHDAVIGYSSEGSAWF